MILSYISSQTNSYAKHGDVTVKSAKFKMKVYVYESDDKDTVECMNDPRCKLIES